MILLPENGTFVGHAGLNIKGKEAEIGIVIGETKFWNKGIATSALNQLVTLAKKKFKLRKLTARIDKKNIASINLFKKAKFEMEKASSKEYVYWLDFPKQK